MGRRKLKVQTDGEAYQEGASLIDTCMLFVECCLPSLEARQGPQGSTASQARLRRRHSSQAWGERRCGARFRRGLDFKGPGPGSWVAWSGCCCRW